MISTSMSSDIGLASCCHHGNIRAMPKAEKPVRSLRNPQVGARVNEELLVEVKVLAVRQRRRFNELIEEALQDLLKKYREKRK